MQALVDKSQRVRVVRAIRGLDQVELAEKAGVSRQTVGNLETGRFGGRAGTLDAVAAALEVPLEVLQDDGKFLAWLASQMRQPAPVIPPGPAPDPATREVLELLRQLGPDRARHALALLRSLLGLQGEPPRGGKG